MNLWVSDLTDADLTAAIAVSAATATGRAADTTAFGTNAAAFPNAASAGAAATSLGFLTAAVFLFSDAAQAGVTHVAAFALISRSVAAT